MCGSTEYMAPEALLGNPHFKKKRRKKKKKKKKEKDRSPEKKLISKSGKGYSKEVDWWALGVVLYEMMTGKCCFQGPTKADVHQSILYAPVPFVDSMSKEAMSLILLLLKRDPTRRLGAGAMVPLSFPLLHLFFLPLFLSSLSLPPALSSPFLVFICASTFGLFVPPERYMITSFYLTPLRHSFSYLVNRAPRRSKNIPSLEGLTGRRYCTKRSSHLSNLISWERWI